MEEQVYYIVHIGEYFGIIFIKLIYPYTSKLDNIMDMGKGAKIATVAFFIFMSFNMIISMLAGYRQYERMQNIEADNNLEVFLDKHYPDSIMDVIFSNKMYTSQGGRTEK